MEQMIRIIKFPISVLALPFLFSSCVTSDHSTTPQKSLVSSTDAKEPNISGLKKRIIVLPVLGDAHRFPDDFKEKVQLTFMRELNLQGSVLAVDGKELQVDLKKFMTDEDVVSPEYKLEEIVKGSKKMGAVGLLEAKIIDFRVKNKSDAIGIVRKVKTVFEAKIRMRIMGIAKNKEIFNTTKTVEFEEENIRVGERVETDRFIETNPDLVATIVKDAFLEFSPQIAKSFDVVDWEGRVAAIQGERIYINVGQISGIQIGDILKVTDEGEEIFDPQTGRLIGQAPGRAKGTIEVTSFFGKDGAIAIVHSGAGFKENDRLIPYE